MARSCNAEVGVQQTSGIEFQPTETDVMYFWEQKITVSPDFDLNKYCINMIP